jgi:hypothetical protein
MMDGHQEDALRSFSAGGRWNPVVSRSDLSADSARPWALRANICLTVS